jgi:hypothetical protein
MSADCLHRRRSEKPTDAMSCVNLFMLKRGYRVAHGLIFSPRAILVRQKVGASNFCNPVNAFYTQSKLVARCATPVECKNSEMISCVYLARS